MAIKVLVDRCIYCHGREALTDEHVFPLALGGDLILVKASCRPCAAITSAFELRLTRGHWHPARRILQLPSRRPRRQPDHFPARATYDGATRDVDVAARDIPLVVLPNFREPGIWAGRDDQGLPIATGMGLLLLGKVPDMTVVASPTGLLHPGGGSIDVPIAFNLDDFVRFLAKVALGYAVYTYGPDYLAEVFVRDLILGQVDGALHWVGELHDKRLIGPMLPGTRLNAALARTNGSYVAVYIQLFRMFPPVDPLPIYQVVVGSR